MIQFLLATTFADSAIACSPQSAVVDSRHYATVGSDKIAIHDSDGKPFETIPAINASFSLDREYIGFDVNGKRSSFMIQIRDGRASLIEQQPWRISGATSTVLTLTDESRTLSYTIDVPLPWATPAILRSATVLERHHQPIALNVSAQLSSGNGTTGVAGIMLLASNTATALASPMPSAIATAVEDGTVLGVTSDGFHLGELTFGPETSFPMWHPFIYNKHGFTLIKKLRPVPTDIVALTGNVMVVPRAQSPDGRIILCERRQSGPQTNVSSVILFRDRQAEVLSQVNVQGTLVTPRRVIHAKAGLAILEGTDSKGKTVAFTYHLR